MTVRRWVCAVAALVLAGALVGVGRSYASVAGILAPGLFGMTRISDRLFADSAMGSDQRVAVAAAVVEARRNVGAFWGSVVAEPTVIACSTPGCYRRLGGGSDRGHTILGHLLLSPRGLDEVIATHEWTHAELTARVGRARVPAWFSEGLAVVASEDPRYAEANWQRDTQGGGLAPALSEMESLRGFLDHRFAYLTGAHEVRRWLSQAGREGLLQLVDALKNGTPFQEAYRRVEAEESTTPPDARRLRPR